jgi:hypothetical protein
MQQSKNKREKGYLLVFPYPQGESLLEWIYNAM